ncbi:MAG TPA: hypothetical protein VGN72_14585 [Tepidisphaeraceae bacterium]|jgi:hypothetical protein|nr:hypothetical protein [Tepidisphaeraceae bacterium]
MSLANAMARAAAPTSHVFSTELKAAQDAAIKLNQADREHFLTWFQQWHHLITDPKARPEIEAAAREEIGALIRHKRDGEPLPANLAADFENADGPALARINRLTQSPGKPTGNSEPRSRDAERWDGMA